MKAHLSLPRLSTFAALTPLLFASAQAGVAPYVTDASTLYLYHLDEASGTSIAANAVGGGSSAISVDGNPLAAGVATTVTTVLGSTGFTGFGRCANLSANDLGLGVNSNGNATFDASGATTPDSIAISSLLGSGSTFTIEAMVNLPSLTAATNRHIWCTDSNNATRGFQFRITAAGLIEFNFIGTAPAGFTVAIPTTGPEAFAANQWFHIALVHDETGGTITNRVYWTKVDAARTAATLLTTNNVETVLGTVTGPLVLGNEGRNVGGGVNMTEGFLGLIDEARISNVAKTDSQFIFFNDDTDSDGLRDTWEILYFGNLTAQGGGGDPDGDLHFNSDEFLANTNPTVQFSSPDSDADGLPDGWEVHWFAISGEDLPTITAKYSGTDDPDSDGFRNSAEFAANTSPTDAAFNPIDTDGDGPIDSFEQAYFSNLTQTGSADPDSDGFTNLQEQAAGSNPTLLASTPTDTDGDGVLDSAETFQPYTADSNTLHLWHLDEVKAPASDAGSNALSLTSLENGGLLWSPSLAGFKTGLDVSAGRATAAGGLLSALPLAADATDNATMQYAGADGAFTFEAIVKIGFDPTVTQAAGDASAPMQILSGEGDVGTNRVWQFRLTPIGTNNIGTAPTLEFINIHGEVGVQTISAPVPTGSDPNAITQGDWYHVAVTYNGAEATADNVKLYWTKLDPSRTAANPILSAQMTDDLITESPDFVIGNEGRVNGGSTGNLVGVIDEVRISSVARFANQFLFTASADSDADSMLDTWETTYFGGLGQPATGDFDNDGTDNLTEFRLGLIPNVGTSRFAAAITGATLQWPSNTGISFTVQRSTDLSFWETLNTVTGTAGSATYTDPAPPSGKAFYKVILNP